MRKKSVKVRLAEAHHAPVQLQFSESPGWFGPILSELDEGNSTEVLPQRRVQADFSLRKQDELFLAQGTFNTEISQICSRCGNTFAWPLMEKFEYLISSKRRGSLVEESDEIVVLEKDEFSLEEVFHEQMQLARPLRPLCPSETVEAPENFTHAE